MPELSYRAATPADLPFLVDLLAMDNVAGPTATWTDADAALYGKILAEIDADPNEELYVAELDGTPIGTFQLSFLPGLARRGMWRGLIEAVHIAPAWRNQGHGSTMIRRAIERCRERGCGMVQLTSNKARLDAHRFYRALGFEQSHEGFKLFL